MICSKCGNVVRSGADVCDICGTRIRQEGASSLYSVRQGRKPENTADPRRGAVRPAAAQQPLPDAPLSESRRPRRGTEARESIANKELGYKVKKFMPNWVHIGLAAAAAAVVAIFAAFVYLKVSDHGQLILARMGMETSDTALWIYGQELMDRGSVEDSILVLEKARSQNPDAEDMYEKLKRLAEAYEAGGRPDDAEQVFRDMTESDPKAGYAYENIVRLMLSQGREMEAADFLKVAYEKTGLVTFNTQRTEMLPKVPTASLGGGKYSSVKTLELSSEEGYSIYYLFGQGTLPEDGTLYSEPITLDEGYWGLRAVAVSSTLTSDELAVNYTVSLPAPLAPYANVASNTYKSAQVKLKNLNDFPVTIYYTIDSTSPTANSPIYDGTPITIPGGRSIHLKAVCVDANGRVSNELDVEYEIEQKFVNYYREEDSFTGFTLMKTHRDTFVKKYGSPDKEEYIDDKAIHDQCISLTYSWGEARFFSSDQGFTLYYVQTNSSSMQGPRSTKVGMTEEKLLSSFRDLGQKCNQDGTRSLYHDDKVGTGMVYPESPISNRIEYIFYREGGALLTLIYHTEHGTVDRISVGCSYPSR